MEQPNGELTELQAKWEGLFRRLEIVVQIALREISHLYAVLAAEQASEDDWEQAFADGFENHQQKLIESFVEFGLVKVEEEEQEEEEGIEGAAI